jgi:transcriptional regulator with XRE-family HTH domain
LIPINKDILQKNFGRHIRDIRIKKGLTQVEVSSSMNKDQQSLQRIESGKVSPSLYYLFELSEGLGISIQELVSFDVTNK